MTTPLDMAAEAAFEGDVSVMDTTTEPQVEISAVGETVQEQSVKTPAETAPAPEAEDNQKVAEDVENFSHVNPDELPEELKAVYKSLQADYTKKRQADSGKVKELEAQLAELQEQLTTGKVKQAVADTASELSAEEKLREIARQEMKAQRESEWEKSALQDIESMDSRLNSNHPDYDAQFDLFARSILDKKLEEFVEKNETKVGFDYKTVLVDAKKEWDDYLDKKNKSFIEKQKVLAKEKEATLKKQSPSTSKAESKPSERLSLDDAAQMAFE